MTNDIDAATDAAIKSAPIKRVRVGNVKVDEEIQRTLDRPRVNAMAEQYDPNALGVITVNVREDGTYIVDGQHRVASTALAAGEDAELDARVFEGLSRPEEALLFRRLNTTKRPMAYDLFRSRLVEGDDKAAGIREIYERHGWKLGFGPGKLSAVSAMERIYYLEPLALDRAIYVLTQVWGHSKEAGDGRVIEGLGLFFWRHGDAVEIDSLIQKLKTSEGGASGLIGKARSIKELTNKPISRSMAEFLTNLYNKNRKTRALTAFDGK